MALLCRWFHDVLSGGHNGVQNAVLQFQIHNLRWNMKRGAERAGSDAPICFDLPLLIKAKKAGLLGLVLSIPDLQPTKELFLYDYSTSLLASPERLAAMKDGEWEQLVLRSKGMHDLPAWRPAPPPQLRDLISSPTPPLDSQEFFQKLAEIGRAVLAKMASPASTPLYHAGPGAASPACAGGGAGGGGAGGVTPPPRSVGLGAGPSPLSQ
jgi:hypothetical protein